MKLSAPLPAILAGAILAACGGSSKDDPPPPPLTAKQQIVALEDAGGIPKLDRSPTLTGTDSDGNGVRDDIDSYLAAHYPQAPQRAAALQTAKAMQKAMTVDKNDVLAVKAVDRELARGINCIYARFAAGGDTPPSRVTREVESVTANTKERLLAYLALSKALDGTSSALPEGDTCD